ncbi:fatty acid hydroxylase [alpha proteobacterium AAP81b]|nr:fatty acid hydroxylase [alpha proteobacterium AAP81b]
MNSLESRVNAAAPAKTGIWNRSHYLDRMTFGELVVAYFQHYAIQAYLVLAVASIVVAALYPPSWLGGIAAAAFSMFAYSVVWYALHRWVLHGRWMWKSKALAPAWKRIHYDHHQDPNHLEVLFGALYTTLPTLMIFAIPIGYAIDGIGGAATAFASALLMTCFYEFCHCIQHLAYKPRWKFLGEMKARHMAHHFHDETGNFGITSFVMDRALGTFYARAERPNKSPSVFNLGYSEEVARTYPYVKELSGGIIATGHPRKRQDA